MFSKAKTDKERQKIFDDYYLNLLKKKRVRKLNKKIAKEAPTMESSILLNQEKESGAFESYVDFLVVRNFLSEQIAEKLKVSKTLASSFVNKLNSNEVMVLSKSLNDFIDFIKNNYQNVNDFILKNSFTELKKIVGIQQVQAQNQAVINQHQNQQSNVINANVPAPAPATPAPSTPAPAPAPSTPAASGSIDPEEGEDFQETLEKFADFITLFSSIKGNVKKNKLMIISELYDTITQRAFSSTNIKKKPRDTRGYYSAINDIFGEKIFENMNNPTDTNKNIRVKNQKYIKRVLVQLNKDDRDITESIKNVFPDKIVGSGMNQSDDKYLIVGNYKAIKRQLLGGRLVVRTKQGENQVNSIPSEAISSRIADILLKVSNGENVSFGDVDKLNEIERNQLYDIGRKLNVKQLFDIPSTLKNKDEKLVDEFHLLSGSIVNGNDNQETINKFKKVLVQVKHKKLIPLKQYNDLMDLLLTMGY